MLMREFKMMAQAYADFDALHKTEYKLKNLQKRYINVPIFFTDALAEIKDAKVAVGRFAVSLTDAALEDIKAARASIEFEIKETEKH